MKSSLCSFASCLGNVLILVTAWGLITAPAARAGLSLNIDLYRTSQGQTYVFYTPLTTNALPPAAALGTYVISSPAFTFTNGSRRGFELTATGLNDRTEFDYENGYPDFNTALRQITNGTWTILFTNTTTTNLYTFTVSAPNLTSNQLPATIITYPADGSLNVPNQPTFAWQGPADWPVNGNPYVANYDFSVYQAASIPDSQDYWTIPTPLPNGLNGSFRLNYVTNYSTPLFVTTTPLNTNAAHQPVAGWTSTSTIETGDQVSFAVTNPPAAGLTLIARYAFDNSANLGQDSSGQGNDLTYNGGNGVMASTTAAAGTGAAYFDGGSFFSYTATPARILNTLAGDFSLAFWISTTETNGSAGGEAWGGDGIVAADVPGSAYDLVPAALDGGGIGFNTGPYDDTLNSTVNINDGNYHQVVITRSQATGAKQIYIDGVLNTSDTAILNPLSDPHLVAIGCAIDASQTDPANANPGEYFQGLLDDIQIYSGVLPAGAVAQLYANPGSDAVSPGGGHTLIAHYTFDDGGNPGLDSSSQGNDINCSSGWGAGDEFSTDAIAGAGARQFFGGSSLTPCGQAFTSWTNTLAGSFTVSAWINTTSVAGNDGDNLSDYNGQSIVYADNNNLGATPVAITGSKAAFRTTDPDGNDDTLHSLQSVTTGAYVHIVATRDQITGTKNLYINGMLDNSDVASTEALSGAQYVSIGGELSSAYQGLVDDVQIYSGVLSSSEVAYLYNHPGSNVLNTTGQDFNAALGTFGLAWSTSGDSDWFVETTNTFNGAFAAAQSGSVSNDQSTTLTTTVTGPGNITFYWSSIANDPNQGFDYEFYVDDPATNDLADLYSGINSWQQFGPIHIPAGQHTLGWTVYANGDTDPTQAGFLDQVSFTPPDTSPVSASITLDISRGQDPTFGDDYLAFPSFDSVTPPATGTTTNVLQSPNGWFGTSKDAGGGGSGSIILSSLDQLINECTNGLWTLYINKGMPTERQFHFSAVLNGLTTNLLSVVRLITPTNGATGVPASTPFQWNGPATYSSLTVSDQQADGSGNVNLTLPATATHWPSPPLPAAGTNQFEVDYVSNNFPGLTFTLPVDSNDMQTVSSWVTQVNLHTTATAIFVVTAGPSTTTLLNPVNNGVNIQFAFRSQTGFTNSVQYRTNLVAGAWQTYTNVAGDGTTKTILIPLSAFSSARQGFVRVLTQ